MFFELVIPAVVEVRQGVRLRALGHWEQGSAGAFIAQYADCEDGVLFQSEVDREATAFIGYVADVRRAGSRTRMLFASRTSSSSLSFADQWWHNIYIQVPAMWSAAQERSDLEAALLPNANTLKDIERGGTDRYDVSAVTWALNKQAQATKVFSYEPLFIWFGTICNRVEGMMRMLRRVEHLQKTCIALEPMKYRSGYKYVEGEIRLEAVTLLEQAAWTTYATLDVLSLIINHVFGLGRESYHCHYRAVLGISGLSDDEEGARLTDRYPDDPLTRLLLEREDWVAGLRSLRHNLAHASNLIPVHGSSTISASLLGPSDQFQPHYEIEQSIRQWTERLTELLDDAFKVIEHRAETAVSGVQLAPVVVKPTVKTTRCESQLRDSFVLLSQGLPDSALYLYSRFGKSAKRQWKFREFESYLKVISNPRVPEGEPMLTSLHGDEQAAELTYEVLISERRATWRFRSEKSKNEAPVLAFRRSEWPPSLTIRTSVTEVSIKQDGQRAIFTIQINNSTDEHLRDVVVAIYQTGIRWAETSIGDVGPLESRIAVAVSGKDVGQAIEGVGMPLVSLLMQPGMIQTTYKIPTDMGTCWSEEHSYKLAKKKGADVGGRAPGFLHVSPNVLGAD